MASIKAEKPIGAEYFGQVKKEATKASDGATKSGATKSGSKKGGAAQKPQEPKKKGKGGKSAKH